MKRILVPVDFSAASANACQFALEVAHKVEAEIKLFHAFYDPITEMGFPLLDQDASKRASTETLATYEKQAVVQIQKLYHDLESLVERKKLNVIIDYYTLSKGQPEKEITKVANNYKPDLIVMGAKGKDRSGKLFFGSTTTTMIDKAISSVLAVPEGAYYTGFKKMMYVSDFKRNDMQVLRKLTQFLEPFKTKLHCVLLNHYAIHTADTPGFDNFKQEYKEMYPESNIDFHYVDYTDSYAHLEDFIINHKIDTLAVHSYKRNFFEKFFDPGWAKKMLENHRLPLLAFVENGH